jgi:hypothetical protein
MTQSPLLEFESSAFAVVPGEDEKTNPGIYGKALAQWLAEQLRAAGFSVEDVIAEDLAGVSQLHPNPTPSISPAQALGKGQTSGACSLSPRAE